MKGRIRPISHPRDQPMPNRIKMHVFDMPSEIVPVTYRVLPISPLPKRVFTAPISNKRNTRRNNRAGKTTLYPPPTVRIVHIILRQRNHGVQMLRQHHNSIDRERRGLFRDPKRRSQSVDMIHQHCRPTIRQSNRKEICPARHAAPPISHHGLYPRNPALSLAPAAIATECAGAKNVAWVKPGFYPATKP